MKKVYFFLLLLLIAEFSNAANITWTNANGTGLWNDAGNWSATVPGPADLAIFNTTSTDDCLININVNVRGIALQTGYTGTVTQGAGFRLTVGTQDVFLAEGAFIGGDSPIDMNDGNFVIRGGRFVSTSDTLFLDVNLVVTDSGLFYHNSGTIKFNDGANRAINVNSRDTLFNMVVEPTANNLNVDINTSDTLRVLNKLILNQGRMRRGVMEVEDSLILNPNYDLGNAQIWLVGAGNSEIFVNGDVGSHPYIVAKDNATDEVTVSNQLGATIDWGATNDRLLISSGVLNLTEAADLDFNEIELLSAGTLIASNGETRCFGGWDNQGGTFDAQQGTWIWDFNTNRNYRSTVVDTFYNFIYEPIGDRELRMLADDSIFVANRLALFDGRVQFGNLLLSDTSFLFSTYDNGTADLWFVGSGHAQFFIESAVGRFNVFVRKANTTDTVYFRALNGNTLNIGETDRDLTIQEGILSLAKVDTADLDFSDIFIQSGAALEASNGLTRYQGSWSNQSGSFYANQGSWIWDNPADRNFVTTVVDTFFNFNYNPLSNRRLNMAIDDSIYIDNKLELSNGRLQAGQLLVHDTAYLYATYDDGNADLRFVGTKTSNFIIEAAQGNFDKFIVKDNPDDTVFYQPLSGNSLTIGETDRDLTIQEGVLSFALVDSVDLDYGDLNIETGAQLQASSGTTTYQGNWNNQGGLFNANGGNWIWDNTGDRNYTSTQVDTFFNFIYEASDNRRLRLQANDSIYIENKLELINGRIQTGQLLAHDTAYLFATYDDANADLYFVGTKTSNFIIEAAQGNFDKFIRKDNPTDTVFYQPLSGNSLTIGETDRDLRIEEGVLSFDLVDTADLDYRNIFIEAGAQLQASPGLTRYQGRYNNIAGEFDHNEGTWIYDLRGDRSFTSHQVDTFFRMIFEPISGNHDLSITAGDGFAVEQALFLNQAGIFNGTIYILDSLEINPNYDNNGSADLYFEGPQDGTIVANSSDGNHDYYINKSNSALKVEVVNEAGGQLIFGNTNQNIILQEGRLEFPSNDTINSQFINTNLFLGSTYQMPSGTMFFRGNWDNDQGKVEANGGNFIYRPSSNRNYSTTEVDTFFNFTYNSNGNRSLTMGANDTIRVENELVLINGRLRAGVISALGNVTVESGYDGDNGQADLQFSGPNPQTFSLTGGTDRMDGDILFDKSVAEDVTLNSLFDVDRGGQSITFNKGYLVTTQTNTLFIDGSHAMIGANDSSFVKGPVTKRGNQTFTYPIGDTIYAPLAISNVTNGSAQFRAEYIRKNPELDGFDVDMLEAGLNNVSIIEYWQLDRLATTASCRVNLSWRPNSAVDIPAELSVARWNSTSMQWENEGNNATTGDANNGTVTSSLINTFSPFSLASTTVNNPLPVTYKYFEAIGLSNMNLLEWTTVSEVNANYFEIEKSKDGKVWEALGIIAANGNSNAEINYRFTDFDIDHSVAYYRLKQYDFDGSFEYSEVRAVNRNHTQQTELNIYPNPVANGVVTLSINDFSNAAPTIRIVGINGMVVMEKRLNTSFNQRIDLDVSQLSKGTYFVRVEGFQEVITEKLIIL